MDSVILRAAVQAVDESFSDYRRQRECHIPENEAMALLGVQLRERLRRIGEASDKLTTGAELAHNAFVRKLEKAFYAVFKRDGLSVDLVERWRAFRVALEAAMQPELFT